MSCAWYSVPFSHHMYRGLFHIIYAAVIFRYNLISFAYLLLLLVLFFLPGPRLKSQKGATNVQPGLVHLQHWMLVWGWQWPCTYIVHDHQQKKSLIFFKIDCNIAGMLMECSLCCILICTASEWLRTSNWACINVILCLSKWVWECGWSATVVTYVVPTILTDKGQ